MAADIELDYRLKGEELPQDEHWYRPKIDRDLMRSFLQKNDFIPSLDFGLWVMLMVASGYLALQSWGTWWSIPAFFLYGTIYSSCDARWHELQHGTVFKTKWVNEVLYHITSFMTVREAYLWRWSHKGHHAYTHFIGHDPEIAAPRPPKLFKMATGVFYIAAGLGSVKRTLMHASGRIFPDAQHFVPKGEQSKMIWNSRLYVVLWALIPLTCLVTWSLLPAFFIVTPRFYGGWLHYLLSTTQHVGLQENVKDHRINTRTVLLNPVFRYLYCNMNYHLEHHIMPMVPYYHLPAYHLAIRDQLPTPYIGMIGAYKEIIPTLLKQKKDPSYFAVRDLNPLT